MNIIHGIFEWDTIKCKFLHRVCNQLLQWCSSGNDQKVQNKLNQKDAIKSKYVYLIAPQILLRENVFYSNNTEIIFAEQQKSIHLFLLFVRLLKHSLINNISRCWKAF